LSEVKVIEQIWVILRT